MQKVKERHHNNGLSRILECDSFLSRSNTCRITLGEFFIFVQVRPQTKNPATLPLHLKQQQANRGAWEDLSCERKNGIKGNN